MALTKIPSSLLDTSSGLDLGGNITLGDNEKVLFGAGSDLQIYHNGNNSFLEEAGTGDFYIRGANSVRIQSYSDNEDMIKADKDGAVTLYHNNGARFATSSTGATVTGNLAVTGDLDITGNVNSYNVTDLDVTDQTITLGAGQTEANSGGSGIIVDGSSASILWDETNDEWDFNKKITSSGTITSSGSGVTNVMSFSDRGVFGTTSNHAVEIRTNNTEAIRIDTSGNVGIGTSSPTSVSGYTVLDLTGSNGGIYETSNGTQTARLYTTVLQGYVGTSSNHDFGILTNETERVHIDTSGNVGIGTSSPNRLLHISGATNDAARVRVHNSAGGQASLDLDNSEGYFRMFTDGGTWRLYDQTDGAYRMYVDTSGKVGIGTTSPSNNLHIAIDGGGEGILVKSTGDHSGILQYDVNRNDGNRAIAQLNGLWNGTSVADIQLKTGSDTTNKDDGEITFHTSSANNIAERMRISTGGNVGIGTTSPSYKLEIASGSFGFNLGTGDLGNHYFILNAGTNNDGGFVLKRDNSNQYQIVNNASGNLTIYQYANSKEIFNIDTAGTTNFYGDAIKLPTGGTSDRPSTAVIGMMRYNTDLDVVEIYDSVSGEWRALQVGPYSETPRFIGPTTYHTDHFKIIGPTGQRADADFNSGYGAVTLNCSFVGNFTVLSKWAHDYMGIGIAYRDNLYNSTFTGESNDSTGPYGGSASVDGFDSSVSYMGQYHWPVQGQGSTTAGSTYYIKHQRSGNTISTHYSTNSAAEFDKDHSSWSQVQSGSVSSNNECKPLWGEAAGTENEKLTLSYVEGEYHTKNYSGNQEIIN